MPIGKERKVWTLQSAPPSKGLEAIPFLEGSRVPVKDRGPQGYGKCNRKHSADLLSDRLKMLGLGPKPYLERSRVLQTPPKARQGCRLRYAAMRILDE